jgi:hypothetical protein
MLLSWIEINFLSIQITACINVIYPIPAKFAEGFPHLQGVVQGCWAIPLAALGDDDESRSAW